MGSFPKFVLSFQKSHGIIFVFTDVTLATKFWLNILMPPCVFAHIGV